MMCSLCLRWSKQIAAIGKGSRRSHGTIRTRSYPVESEYAIVGLNSTSACGWREGGVGSKYAKEPGPGLVLGSSLPRPRCFLRVVRTRTPVMARQGRRTLGSASRGGCASPSVGVFFSTSSGENSRSKLIREVVAHHGDNFHRLVFESRGHRDLNDQRLLIAMRLAGESPARASFEHLLPYEEPLLWVSDAIAWSWRAKGDWRRRVVPIVAPVVRINP